MVERLAHDRGEAGLIEGLGVEVGEEGQAEAGDLEDGKGRVVELAADEPPPRPIAAAEKGFHGKPAPPDAAGGHDVELDLVAVAGDAGDEAVGMEQHAEGRADAEGEEEISRPPRHVALFRPGLDGEQSPGAIDENEADDDGGPEQDPRPPGRSIAEEELIHAVSLPSLSLTGKPRPPRWEATAERRPRSRRRAPGRPPGSREPCGRGEGRAMSACPGGVAVERTRTIMAGVTLSRLTKLYGEVEAVGGIDLAIADKEFVVLVGPSGCGKSTTLRMIAGLEDVTSGEIRIGERVVNELEPKDRDIAMVFQDYALYPHMSVFENMGFGLRYRKYSKAEIRRRVERAAEILNIKELLRRRPKQLSGGQRQRVAMGRAIVRDPQVFLFDEPLSNLDAKLRIQMRTEIKRLHRRVATTVVYVTHDQVEAMTLADRIVIMRAGLIEQVGTPDDIYNNPATTYVAGFIGAPTMNLLSADLDGDGAELALRLADGSALPLPEARHDHYRRHRGSRVTFGIRPEDFRIARDGEPALEVEPDVVEPLGSDTLVFFTIGETELVARLPPREVRGTTADRLRLHPDLAQMHLFDVESGRAL